MDCENIFVLGLGDVIKATFEDTDIILDLPECFFCGEHHEQHFVFDEIVNTGDARGVDCVLFDIDVRVSWQRAGVL